MALVIDIAKHDRESFRRTMGHKRLGFEQSEMMALMTQAGFVDVNFGALPAEPQGLGPGLFACTGRAG